MKGILGKIVLHISKNLMGYFGYFKNRWVIVANSP